MNMELTQLGYWSPQFSQPTAISLTNVTTATLDNWLRYGHIQPVHNEARQRRFSFADLLTIDCMEMLVSIFKIPPALAAGFARRAVEQYEVGFEDDRRQIDRGVPWAYADRDLDAHFSFAREGMAVVEVAPGEKRPDSVMLVLPVRMIARRLLGATCEHQPAREGAE